MEEEKDYAENWGDMLSPKRERFCQEYVKDFNGARAAREAGYSEDSAKEYASYLLTIPNVILRVETLKEQAARVSKVSKDMVIDALVEIAQRCLEAEPMRGPFGVLIKDEEGRQIFKFDAKGAARAVELLGKHQGMFEETKNVNLNGNGVPFRLVAEVEFVKPAPVEKPEGSAGKEPVPPVPDKPLAGGP